LSEIVHSNAFVGYLIICTFPRIPSKGAVKDVLLTVHYG